MSWADVGRVITATIVSVGGIGVIAVGVVSFLVNQIADRLSQKYKLKLDQEIEKYKSELTQKEYVSKMRFDTEFQIYRELSISFFELVKSTIALIPANNISHFTAIIQNTNKEKFLNEARDLSVSNQNLLYKNAPFISEKIFNLYSSILHNCLTQIDIVSNKTMSLDDGNYNSDDYQRSKEIKSEFLEVSNEVRGYLASLEIIK